MALRVYLWGALFAAIDFPLIYAFYARNNTLLPALVGVLSALVYGVFALALVEGLGFLGLVWADTAKQAAHALVMLALLFWKLGSRQERRSEERGERKEETPVISHSAGEEAAPLSGWMGATTRTLLYVSGAAAAMAVVMIFLLARIDAASFPFVATDLLQIGVAGGIGALVYGGGLLLVGQAEAHQLSSAALRFGRILWRRTARQLP